MRVGDVPLRRWRQPNDATVAIQAGLGVYSIHGFPPYQSWKAFRSRVVSGLEALFSAWAAVGYDGTLSTVSLRYVNVFSESLLGKHTPAAFIEKILGFKCAMPAAVVVNSKSFQTLGYQLGIDFDDTTRAFMALFVTPEQGGREVVVWDLTRTYTASTAMTESEILHTLDEHWAWLHNVFVETTRPIHEVMEPVHEPEGSETTSGQAE
jgi:uncharacterized protein (TIGR04255 family)